MGTESEMGRRHFLKSIAAGIALPALGMDILGPAGEMELARQTMISLLGISNVRLDLYPFSDHIAHDVEPNAIIMGEIDNNMLHLAQEFVNNWGAKREIFNGIETPDQDRLQQVYDSVRIPKMAIATDGVVFFYPDSYLSATSKTFKPKLMIQGLVYGASAIAGFTIAYETLVNRRSFLKALGLGSAIRATGKFIDRQIDLRLDLTDLSSLKPFEQQIFRELTLDETVAIRNKIMTLNMKALASVPLSMISDELIIFAGAGHRAMAQEILRPTEDVASDLRYFLLGDEQQPGMIIKFLTMYKSTHDNEDRQLILNYAVSNLASMFSPVKIRFNYKNDKDLQTFNDMRTSVRQAPVSDSAFVIFTRALAEAEKQYNNDADAQDFFWNLSSALYGNNAPDNFTVSFSINPDERMVIAHPVAIQPDQEGIERIDIAGHSVFIRRGFVIASI